MSITASSLPVEVTEKYARNNWLVGKVIRQAMAEGRYSPGMEEGRLNVRENYSGRQALSRIQRAQEDPELTVNQRNHLRFLESFVNVVDTARSGVRESFGPMSSGGPTSVGSRGDNPPHSPAYRPRRVRGDIHWDPGLRRASQKEEEFRRHLGITCQQAHGVLPHREWVQFCMETSS